MFSYDHLAVNTDSVTLVGTFVDANAVSETGELEVTDLVAFKAQFEAAYSQIRKTQLDAQKARLAQLQDLLARTQAEIEKTQATIATYADVDVPEVAAIAAPEAPAEEVTPVEAPADAEAAAPVDQTV